MSITSSEKRGMIIILFLSFVITCVSIMFVIRSSTMKTLEAQTAQRALEDLYYFSDAYQLADNNDDLKKITTDAVYNQLTVDNTERALNTYLKFKNKPTSIDIVRITDSYIVYHLNNEFIDHKRVFVFLYEINNKGKIDYVRELEGIDFIENDN